LPIRFENRMMEATRERRVLQEDEMAPGNPHTPEGRARDRIDALLEAAGWVLQW
jgi:hypothetical protein